MRYLPVFLPCIHSPTLWSYIFNIVHQWQLMASITLGTIARKYKIMVDEVETPEESNSVSGRKNWGSQGVRGFGGHTERYSPCSIFCSRAPPSFADGFVGIGAGPEWFRAEAGITQPGFFLPSLSTSLPDRRASYQTSLHSSVLTRGMGELQEHPFTWLSGRLREVLGRHLEPCLAQASPFMGYYPSYIANSLMPSNQCIVKWCFQEPGITPLSPRW